MMAHVQVVKGKQVFGTTMITKCQIYNRSAE